MDPRNSDNKKLGQVTQFLPEIYKLLELLNTTSDISTVNKTVSSLETQFKEAQEVVSQLSSETTEQLKEKLAAYKSANHQQKILLKEYRHLAVFTEQN